MGQVSRESFGDEASWLEWQRNEAERARRERLRQNTPKLTPKQIADRKRQDAWVRRLLVERPKAREKVRRWRAQNVERARASGLATYYRHRDKYLAYKRRYHAAHREWANEYSRWWLRNHRERAAETTRRYRAEHPEWLRAWRKAYRQRHIDKFKAKDRAHYETHRATIREQQRAYYQAHREEILAKRAEKRAVRSAVQ